MSSGESNLIPRPCACTTVRTLSRLLARIYDEALHECDLNVTQLAVLRAIDRMSGEALSRVAASLSMDRTSMYRAVGTMKRRGWIELSRGKDGRSHSAVVSNEGRRVLDNSAPRWEQVQSAIVDRFGRNRWRALVAELQALKESAGIVEIERMSQASEEISP